MAAYNNSLQNEVSKIRFRTFTEHCCCEFILYISRINKLKVVYHNISQKNWLRHLCRRRTNRHTYKTSTKSLGKKRKAMCIKLIRRYCIERYSTNSQMLGSKMAKNLTQKVTIFCNQCINKPHLCLPCFNKLY